MPVISDFQVIHGVNNGVLIGDAGIKPVFEINFNTGGRRRTGHAYLIFMVRGLTSTGPGATVQVNEHTVGTIERHTGGDPNHWYMQTINISGAALKDGNNELEVHAAVNETHEDQFDDFRLKNIFCHFQQSA